MSYGQCYTVSYTSIHSVTIRSVYNSTKVTTSIEINFTLKHTDTIYKYTIKYNNTIINTLNCILKCQ